MKLTGDKPPLLQPKLRISQPNDKYEQEADRVADQVMRMPKDNPFQYSTINSVWPMRNGTDTAEGGRLPNNVRQYLEPRFGRDFDTVRVHHNIKANTTCKIIGAKAATHGTNIYLSSPTLLTPSWANLHLLAHELTHVAQQSRPLLDSHGRVPFVHAFPSLATVQLKSDHRLKPDFPSIAAGVALAGLGPFGQALGTLVGSDRELQRAAVNLGRTVDAFVSGLVFGLGQELRFEDLSVLGDKFFDNPYFLTIFPTVFPSGVAVGILEWLISIPLDLYETIAGFPELLETLEEVSAIALSPEGHELARMLGEAVGRTNARDIQGLLNESAHIFTFKLGRFIGPMIGQIVLSILLPHVTVPKAFISFAQFILRNAKRFPRLASLLRRTGTPESHIQSGKPPKTDRDPRVRQEDLEKQESTHPDSSHVISTGKPKASHQARQETESKQKRIPDDQHKALLRFKELGEDWSQLTPTEAAALGKWIHNRIYAVVREELPDATIIGGHFTRELYDEVVAKGERTVLIEHHIRKRHRGTFDILEIDATESPPRLTLLDITTKESSGHTRKLKRYRERIRDLVGIEDIYTAEVRYLDAYGDILDDIMETPIE
jgi:hypothetical protein